MPAQNYNLSMCLFELKLDPLSLLMIEVENMEFY